MKLTLKKIIACIITGSVIGVIVPFTMNAYGIGFDHSKASHGYYEFIFPTEKKDPKAELIKNIEDALEKEVH